MQLLMWSSLDMDTVTINRLPCRIEETNESVDMARFEKTFRMKDGQQSAIFQGRPLRATEYKNGNIVLAKQDGEEFKEVAKVDKLVSWRLHPVHEKEPLDVSISFQSSEILGLVEIVTFTLASALRFT